MRALCTRYHVECFLTASRITSAALATDIAKSRLYWGRTLRASIAFALSLARSRRKPCGSAIRTPPDRDDRNAREPGLSREPGYELLSHPHDPEVVIGLPCGDLACKVLKIGSDDRAQPPRILSSRRLKRRLLRGSGLAPSGKTLKTFREIPKRRIDRRVDSICLAPLFIAA